MDLESPWSDFYDLLLQDETSPSETEEEWTSVQKTARGQIECQPIMNNKEDDSISMDPEFQTMVNQVLATVSHRNSKSTPVAKEAATQRHYHFHHHHHRSSSSNCWTTTAAVKPGSGSGIKSTSDNDGDKKLWSVMPGTFIHNNENDDSRKCACALVNHPPSSSNSSSSSERSISTSTIWVMDVHAWITSIAFIAHLLLLWFRP